LLCRTSSPHGGLTMHEHANLDPAAFGAGADARLDARPIWTVPPRIRAYQRRSWLAGWRDVANCWASEVPVGRSYKPLPDLADVTDSILEAPAEELCHAV
jgi:hypothetical protein